MEKHFAETRHSGNNDELLGEVVDEYLAALSDGQQPEIAEYAERYPELASVLRVAIPAILATATNSGGNDSLPTESRQRRVGDFRILRQIGRGGMGIVYEAEQISMSRKVALKVLPFAGLVDEQRIARFQNEVRAVAALDHPNIVSVYMVGNERGVHYYAMQLIRGQNLAEVIQSLRVAFSGGKDMPTAALSAVIDRDPSMFSQDRSGDLEITSPGEFETELPAENPEDTVRNRVDSTIPHGSQSEYVRNVAVLAIQAANALQHAHENGIVHRDVKPANLLIDRDANLYLSDFGLARIEADAGVTMTGDMIGTLRYMAPEQATANRVEIDHRADIYSLSVTIYELLTLRPAFDTEDRHTLLQQIMTVEPPPIRRVNSKLPLDLETIVQKGMSKDMEDRYGSCKEFADDLRRFLEHRPIHAKPPTLGMRVAKWTRRNPRLVWATIMSLLLVSLILSGSTWLIAQQRDRAVVSATAATASLYVSEMNQAYQAWGKGNLPRTRTLLANWIPQEGQKDHRGTEWYYLANRCKANRGEQLLQWEESASMTLDGEFVCAKSDGDLVLLNSKTRDRRVLLKDVARTFGEISDSDVSADGSKVAVATKSKIEIVDTKTSESQTITTDSTWYVRFSPDGTLGAHVSGDGTTYLWDANTGHIKWSRPPGDHGQPAAIQFSPEGTTLVTVFQTPSFAEVFAVADGSQRHVVFAQDFIRDFAFLNEDSIVVSGAGVLGSLPVDLRVSTNEDKGTVWMPPTRYVSSLDYSNDFRRLALGTEGNGVEVWDLTKRQLLWRQIRGRAIDSVRLLDDKTVLVSSDGVLESCDLRYDGITQMSSESRYYWCNCVASHGDEIALAGPTNQVVFWDPQHDTSRQFEFKGDLTESEIAQAEVINMAITPDGSRIAFGANSSFWVSGKDGSHIHREAMQYMYGMDYSPNAKWLALGAYGVSILDAETHQVHWKRPNRTSIASLGFSADGNWLAAGSGAWRESGSLSIVRIDGDVFELEDEFEHQQMVMCVKFSPNSRWLVAGDYSGTFVVYDMTTAKVHQKIRAHTMAVQAFDFSPDGSCLVSGSYDGSFKFWQVGTWQELGEVSDRSAVQGLEFYSRSTGEFGLFVGRRWAGQLPAEQELHWIEKDVDWSWLR